MSRRTDNLQTVIDGLEEWSVVQADYDQLCGPQCNYAAWFLTSIGDLRKELLKWAKAELRKAK